jgi:choice-of-anchor C domain-containing protein
MRKTLLAGAALVATFALAGSASAAELIVNGHFRNGDTPAPGGFITVGTGFADASLIPGWDVLDGNVDWITGYWAGSDGDGYSIDLDGYFSHATIGQTISTVAGHTYNLTFDIAANPDYAGMRVAVVGANGSTIGTENYNLVGGGFVWEGRSLNFTANSDSTLITFASGDSAENCCFGAAIDNVSVMAVPEPATWALMITGFGGAGAMLRRRRAAFAHA